MREIVRFETEKQKRDRKWIMIVLAAAVICYLWSGFFGSINLYTPYDMATVMSDPEHLNAMKEQQSGVVDDAFVAKWQQSYRDFVDAHRMDDAGIRAAMKKWGEEHEIEDILYDMDYFYLVLPEEIQDGSDPAYSELESITYDTSNAIYFARDPVRAVLECGNADTYPEKLRADFEKTAKRYLSGRTFTAGYIFGWDVLICMMQHLPSMLGITLLVSFFHLFSDERRYGMRALLLASRYGRRQVVTAKLFIMWRRATFCWIMFQAAAAAAVAAVFGLEGAGRTYFAVLNPSVYGLTCIQYYIAQLLVSYLGTLFFSLVICLLSSLLPGKLALIAGAALIAATFHTIDQYSNSIPAFTTAQKILVLTPTQLMGAFNTYQVYQGYAVGDVVLRLPLVSYLVLTAGIAGCLWGIYKRGTKY